MLSSHAPNYKDLVYSLNEVVLWQEWFWWHGLSEILTILKLKSTFLDVRKDL